MAEEANLPNLPEEIIVNIISWLPVKPLVRFTFISKKWRSFILFNPHFANQLRKNKTLNRRLLVCTQSNPFGVGPLISPQLESIDLETLSSSFRDHSLCRKVEFPVLQRPPRPGGRLSLLGSSNGLVFVFHLNMFYVCNPLTGFVKELPGANYKRNVNLIAYVRSYGVGYLPLTGDYKLIVSYVIEDLEEEEEEEEDYWGEEECSVRYEMMSLNDQIWRSIEGPGDVMGRGSGTLVNEVLHWLHSKDEDEMVTFDLGKEEFSKMRLPNFGQDGKVESFLGVCFGGCLCVSRYPASGQDFIDFWVMREYSVSESWTKLVTLRFPNPEHRWPMKPLLIMESCTIALIYPGRYNEPIRISISHKQEGEEEPSFDILSGNWFELIEYEESLVSIAGYNGDESPSQHLRKAG